MNIKISRKRNVERSLVVEDASRAVNLANLLKALAHPLRIRIIAMLTEGDEHVGNLAERLGVKQAIVSQQLRILRMHGLVGVTRVKGFSFYTLTEPRLRELLRCVEGCTIR
jgi:DNA-binding transcriptional ArsR family regulator